MKTKLGFPFAHWNDTPKAGMGDQEFFDWVESFDSAAVKLHYKRSFTYLNDAQALIIEKGLTQDLLCINPHSGWTWDGIKNCEESPYPLIELGYIKSIADLGTGKYVYRVTKAGRNAFIVYLMRVRAGLK